jgi:hypothetical protein
MFLTEEAERLWNDPAAATVEAQCDEAAGRRYRACLDEVTRLLPELRPAVLETGEARGAIYAAAIRGDDLRGLGRRLLEAMRRLSAQMNVLRRGAGAGEDPPPAHPVPRIALTEEGVLLDGRPVPLDMTDEARKAARCFLKHLLAAAGDWRSSTELDDAERATGQAGGCCDHVGIRWDRFRKRLPAPLHNLTESNPRKGYRLLPAAWHR